LRAHPLWLRIAWLLAWVLVGGLSECSSVQAASPAIDEYQIKAAFVCKFTLYVEWPPQAFAEPDGPLVIGLLGPELVAQALAHSAADMAVQGRTIVVRRLARGESLAGVHVLYVAGNSGASAGELLADARGRSLLTVTEQALDWTPALSAINFAVVDDKVRFDVSLPAADASNLKISARLLGVARKVIARPL
jgi:hypothetical protein